MSAASPPWTSVAEMVGALGLGVPAPDVEAVRTAIKKRMIDVHPDHSGGSFASVEQETAFRQLEMALKFLESQSAVALVPAETVAAIVRALQESQLARSAPQTETRAEIQRSTTADARSKYAVPRISSAVVAAVCTGLFAFSGALKDHPALGMFNRSPWQEVLGCLIVASAVTLLLTWKRERTESALLEWLSTEDGFIRTIGWMHLESGKRIGMRTVCSAIADAARYHAPRQKALFPWHLVLPVLERVRVNPAAAEKFARMYLDELEQKGLVKRLPGPQLEQGYEVLPALTQSLMDVRGY